MRFAAIKTTTQQDLQSLVRLHEGAVQSLTALVNWLRGLLGEYGIVVARGATTLRRVLPEVLEAADNGLSGALRRWLNEGRQQQLLGLDAHIDALTAELTLAAEGDERVKRLQTGPGYGPIVASAFAGAMGDGSQYRRSRDASAAIGLVPRQHSDGGKNVMLGISKRGDRYLRCLLVRGARSMVIAAKNKEERISVWINWLRETRGMNKATPADDCEGFMKEMTHRSHQRIENLSSPEAFQGRFRDQDDTCALHHGPKGKVPSYRGRIYGSNPVPIIERTRPCKQGGDHIWTTRLGTSHLPWLAAVEALWDFCPCIFCATFHSN